MKESLLRDVSLGNLITCTASQYVDFVREAIICEKDKNNSVENVSVVRILNAELNRLDDLHL